MRELNLSNKEKNHTLKYELPTKYIKEINPESLSKNQTRWIELCKKGLEKQYVKSALQIR